MVSARPDTSVESHQVQSFTRRRRAGNPCAPISHQQVDEALARFLAAGGHITQLPDTVDEQRHLLRLWEKMDGLYDLSIHHP